MAATLLTRRASLPAPASLDRETRSFQAVIASGTPVRRAPPTPDGEAVAWDEVLAITPQAIDLSHLVGGPLLFAHDQARHIGTIVAARIEGGSLVADLRLSRRPETDPILRDIEDRVIVQTSAGYTVSAWRRQPSAAAGVPTYLAERWRPLEASLLPLGADGGTCRIRSFEKDKTMTETTTDATAAAGDDAPQACGWTAAEALELSRSAAALRVPPAIVDGCFSRGLSIDETRRALINHRAAIDEKITTRSHLRAEMIRDHDGPDELMARMVPALLNRMNPAAHPLPDASREFRALTLAGMRRALLEANGVRTRGWTDDEVITRGLGGLISTSDLPQLLANVLGKSLDQHDADMETPIKLFSRERSANDFRELMTVRLGVETALQVVNEAGEFRRGRIAEEKAGLAVRTAGIVIGLTRQSIINDDLAGLATIDQQLRALGADYEAEAFTTLLVGTDGNGALCSDGVKLFNSAHGNAASTDAAPSVESIGAIRELLRAQKTVGGRIIAGAVPKAIVAPPQLETLLEQLLFGQLAAPDVASANPFSGRLALHIENRLSDPKRWYAVSGQAFQHAYLQAQRGVAIETRMGFDVDGVEIKARLDFGASIYDWRKIAVNHGAAPG